MPNGQLNESDSCYPLDDTAITFFAEGLKQIETVNTQMSGALQLYLRQHKLPGQWRLAGNGRELERIPDGYPVQR